MDLESWPVGTEGIQCAVSCGVRTGAPDAGPAHCSLPYVRPYGASSVIYGSESHSRSFKHGSRLCYRARTDWLRDWAVPGWCVCFGMATTAGMMYQTVFWDDIESKVVIPPAVYARTSLSLKLVFDTAWDVHLFPAFLGPPDGPPQRRTRW